MLNFLISFKIRVSQDETVPNFLNVHKITENDFSIDLMINFIMYIDAKGCLKISTIMQHGEVEINQNKANTSLQVKKLGSMKRMYTLSIHVFFVFNII